MNGGIKRDTSLGKWEYAGEIDQVNYENQNQEEMEEITMAEYRVINGTLNMRKGPGRTYSVIKSIPDGATVNVIADEGQEWMQVEYQGTTGYCMGEFLQKIGDGEMTAIEAAFENVEQALETLRALIIQ